jgi:hypothetical protein
VRQGHPRVLRDPALTLPDLSARHRARAAALTVAALLLTALLAPAAAEAHGLIQRANLPIPEWLFGWAAAAVLIVSFVALAVLWPRPKLQEVTWHPLPSGTGEALGSRPVEIACGAIGAGLLGVVVAAGYLGTANSENNFAPTFILITFWVGLAFASALFGDIFRAFNPWRAVGRGTGWLATRLRGGRPVVHRPYPERLGRWPAALGLLAFTWIELASDWGQHPRTLVSAAVGYSVLTWIAMAVYGTERWAASGETFSVYFNLFSRISPFETRDRVVGVRPPLGGLPRLDVIAGTVAFVLVMIGTVTFDGLSQGAVWRDISTPLEDDLISLGTSLAGAEKIMDTLGLLACVGLVAGFYTLGVVGAKSVGGGFTVDRLRKTFVHSLVPIALVYVAAHYLTFLIFEGQAISYLASDPFGQGWDLFGTASSAINYGVLSQENAWYLEVAFVVAGHAAALTLAHDRALAIYPQPRLAVRSQYWMLGIMVGFTTLALWLLAQAGS